MEAKGTSGSRRGFSELFDETAKELYGDLDVAMAKDFERREHDVASKQEAHRMSLRARDEEMATRMDAEAKSEVASREVIRTQDEQLAQALAQELEDEIAAMELEVHLQAQSLQEEEDARKVRDEREKVDAVAAAVLMKELEDREVSLQLQAEADDASYAHRVAVEERDAELAHIIQQKFEQEEKERLAMKEKCEREDAEVARQHEHQIMLASVEEKKRLHAQLLADGKMAHEVLQKMLEQEQKQADAAAAKAAAEAIAKKRALELAAHIQKQEEEVRERRDAENLVKARRAAAEADTQEWRAEREREKKDAEVAKRVFRQLSRDDSRLKSRENVLSVAKIKAGDKKLSATECVREQWRGAEATIEDVTDGISIMLLLPYLKSLKVEVKDNSTVTVKATRLRLRGETKEEEKTHVDWFSYDAAFVIQGSRSLTLKNEDVTYSYASEDGILHIYVENVQLQGMSAGDKRDMLRSVRSSVVNMLSGVKGVMSSAVSSLSSAMMRRDYKEDKENICA